MNAQEVEALLKKLERGEASDEEKLTLLRQTRVSLEVWRELVGELKQAIIAK